MMYSDANKSIETPDLDKIIQRMDDHIQDFRSTEDRRERFLLMYRTFKNELRSNLQQGRFFDFQWSEAICCRMGEMYFEADEAYRENIEQCPESWQICFDAALAGNTNLLQDALMGMNAHINYDLTICVYDVMENYGDFQAIQETTKNKSIVDRKLNSLLKRRYFDYLLINQIAWESIPKIQDVLTNRFSRLLGLLNTVSFRFTRSLVERLILEYRDRAWTHALLLLSARDGQERDDIRGFMDDLAVSNTYLIKKFVSYNPLNFIRPVIKSDLLEEESEIVMEPVVAALLRSKLIRRETAEYATRTFVEYGSASVPYLRQIMQSESGNRKLIKQIYRILGKIGVSESAELLADRISTEEDPPHSLFKAVLRHNDNDIKEYFKPALLYNTIKDMLHRISTGERVIQDLELNSEDSLLMRTFHDRKREAMKYLVMTLKIIQIHQGLPKKERKFLGDRSYFRLVKEDLGSEWESLLNAVIEENSSEVLQNAEILFDLKPMTFEERIDTLVTGEDEWLKLCVHQYLKDTRNDSSMAKSVRDKLRDESMISTVEKVLHLKNVELFNEIPAEELTSIAEVAQESEFQKNDYLIHQGNPGKNLYIITDGLVNVLKDGTQVTSVEKNAVLGEMSLLSESPTSADCVAATHTNTLQLNQEDFLDFLYEGYPEIALGLIKVLTQRLENTTAQLDNTPA